MIKKTYLGRVSLLAILVAMLLVAPALAAVNFDSTTGTGFVGKGDVQTAFGWNNQKLQDNANDIKFTYVSTDTYEVTEVFATGNTDNPVSLNSHDITVTTTTNVNAVVDNDPRQVKGQKQFTGFILKGFGSSVVDGTVPTPDYVKYVTYTWTDKKGDTYTTDEMPVDAAGNLYIEGNHKAVLSVELTSSTGGLYVNGVPLQ